MQFAEDHGPLPNSRAAAVKFLVADIKKTLPGLGDLAASGAYADLVAECWDTVRRAVLSDDDLAAGKLAEVPTPECCALMWPVLVLLARRGACIASMPARLAAICPAGLHTHPDVDSDDSDNDNDASDEEFYPPHYFKDKLTGLIQTSLPDHTIGSRLGSSFPPRETAAAALAAAASSSQATSTQAQEGA